MKKLNDYFDEKFANVEINEDLIANYKPNIDEAQIDVYECLQDIKDWADKYGAEACVENLCSIFEDYLDDEQIKDIAEMIWEYEQ